MLALVFSVDDEKYALPCRTVVEVLPLVSLRSLEKVPAYVAGLLDYRGQVLPVVDVTHMLKGRPSEAILSSRLVLVHYGERVLGLLAEKVTHTASLNPDTSADAGIEFPDAPYLGKIHSHEEGLIQLIDAEHLLSEEIKELLFQKPEETAS